MLYAAVDDVSPRVSRYAAREALVAASRGRALARTPAQTPRVKTESTDIPKLRKPSPITPRPAAPTYAQGSTRFRSARQPLAVVDRVPDPVRIERVTRLELPVEQHVIDDAGGHADEHADGTERDARLQEHVPRKQSDATRCEQEDEDA